MVFVQFPQLWVDDLESNGKSNIFRPVIRRSSSKKPSEALMGSEIQAKKNTLVTHLNTRVQTNTVTEYTAFNCQNNTIPKNKNNNKP